MSTNESRVYGSGPSADVVVAGEGVAERHCQIVFDVDGYWIEDLLSVSGTYVNGEPVSSRMLRDGDTVHLGAAALIFSNGTLQREVKADVEQPLRMPEVPVLSGSTFDLPDDSPPIRTPGQSRRVRRAGTLSKPARVLLTSLGAVIAGIALLVVLGSNDSDQSSSTKEDVKRPASVNVEGLAIDQCGTELPADINQGTNRDAIAERAFQIVQAKYRQSSSSVPRFSLVMSPNVPAVWEDDIEAYLINSNGFWACELLPNEPATVSFAHWEDKEWLVNQLLETPNYATRAEAEAQADSDTWLGLAVKSSLFLRPPQEWTRIKDFGDITAHEWVHHVQLSLEGYLPADLPCWWDEGHATYLGAAVDAVGITKLQTFERFKRARKLLVYGWSTDQASSRSAKDWRQWLEGQEPGEALWTFCDDDLDVYAAGLLASEYLIGQYGLDAVTRIHGEFKYSVDWETRVSTVYGKSPDALNREIAEYLRSFASIFP